MRSEKGEIGEEGEGGPRWCDGDAASMPPNSPCPRGSTWTHFSELSELCLGDSTCEVQGRCRDFASSEEPQFERQFVLRWGGYGGRGIDELFRISNWRAWSAQGGLGTWGNGNETGSLICGDDSVRHGDRDGGGGGNCGCGGEDRRCSRYGNHCGARSDGRSGRCDVMRESVCDGDGRHGNHGVKNYDPCTRSVDQASDCDYLVHLDQQ